jgi:Asp/Glu/hydantoin racemase
MLDTRFPRILGDAGNVDSYKFPARIHVVTGAGSLDIVKDAQPPEQMITAFCNAARHLEAEGAFAIISTCGFLITIQDRIADAVNIPVMVSSLSLYPKIHAKYDGRPIGILTASSKNLGGGALRAARIDPLNVHITGMENCIAFTNAILQPKDKQPEMILSTQIERFAVEKALSLIDKNPDISAILLECGNLPPYAEAITSATGRAVYSILDGAEQLACRYFSPAF